MHSLPVGLNTQYASDPPNDDAPGASTTSMTALRNTVNTKWSDSNVVSIVTRQRECQWVRFQAIVAYRRRIGVPQSQDGVAMCAISIYVFRRGVSSNGIAIYIAIYYGIAYEC